MTKGATPVLTSAETRSLLDRIDTGTVRQHVVPLAALLVQPQPRRNTSTLRSPGPAARPVEEYLSTPADSKDPKASLFQAWTGRGG